MEKTLPLINIKHYNEWPYKIIYAPKGNSLEQTLNGLNEFYCQHPKIPFNKRPNLIHVAGKYFIHRIPPGGEDAVDGTRLAENTYYGYSEPTDVYALFRAVIEIQGAATASNHIVFEYAKMIAKIRFNL